MISRLITFEGRERAGDGTRKYLFQLDDGESVETVRIPMEKGRATLCVSDPGRLCHGLQPSA